MHFVKLSPTFTEIKARSVSQRSGAGDGSQVRVSRHSLRPSTVVHPRPLRIQDAARASLASASSRALVSPPEDGVNGERLGLLGRLVEERRAEPRRQHPRRRAREERVLRKEGRVKLSEGPSWSAAWVASSSRCGYRGSQRVGEGQEWSAEPWRNCCWRMHRCGLAECLFFSPPNNN